MIYTNLENVTVNNLILNCDNRNYNGIWESNNLVDFACHIKSRVELKLCYFKTEKCNVFLV